MFIGRRGKLDLISRIKMMWLSAATASLVFATSAQAFQRNMTPARTSIRFLDQKHIATPSTCNAFPSTSTRRKSTSLFMMFERMSEPLINALVTSQQESARLNLPSVDTECMLLGILDHPQNARKTLQKYQITFRSARKTVEIMYNELQYPSSDSKQEKSWGSLLNLNKKARDVDLPFTNALKRVLTRAVKIADVLESGEIKSEHVLLSLLDYDPLSAENQAGITETDGMQYAQGAHAVILRLEGIDSTNFSKTEFCRTLFLDLQNPQNVSELVSGGGRGRTSPTPALKEVGVDLTEAARNNELDPVFGRDKEIYMALRTLLRRRKNNPCFIGDPGVGKSAIVEGLAQIIAAPRMLQELEAVSDRNERDEIINTERRERLESLAKLCPAKLASHRVVSIELGNLVAGTKYRGEFEERVQSILQELMDPNAPPTILFMDEIHMLIGAGSAEGGLDAANILKPALARGKIQLIGATTVAEYR